MSETTICETGVLTWLGGIGPTDQLEVVKGSSDGPNFISKESWINTPVGYNLEDHTNVSFIKPP